MSKTKIIEGVEYIQKEHVDEIVRQRIAKYSERLAQTESKLGEYESQLDEAKSKMGLVDNLTSQVESLQSELKTSNSRYERHTTISQFGINDGDVRDMVEWQYDRAMSNLPKKDRVDLGQWLETIKTDPTTAPSTLRPFFETQPNTQPDTTSNEPPQPTQGLQQTQTQLTPPPSSNRGVQSQPTAAPNDLLSRATDPTFYSQNREAIREAYYSRLGQTPHKF
ncbi:MAG: hypothetical protein CL581_12830 [Alteromonadaceae bacterium]|jgi:hypothetical protein|nr:hypothetical protein [Alteromonadaceae bacterium]|tara:strand:- start:2277 stop:2942 length:666 start_codon:yes stop_codon:yes gene_type:complete